MQNRTRLIDKFQESCKAVLPISLTVLLLCFSIVAMPTDLTLAFIVGSAMLIVGLALFNYGADASMTLMGKYVGAKLTKSQKLWLILFVSFILGIIVTMAEPDLNVLADNVPHINSTVLVVTVSVGVGIFLMTCMLRIFMGTKLRWLLLGSYLIVFILAAFVDRNYVSVAFDSGGVTTGPMTVPFIMALGVGVASIRSDRKAEEDSFGLVGLCSVGPIIAVMLLSFFYEGDPQTVTSAINSNYANTMALGGSYIKAIPLYMAEVAKALAPIFLFFLVFQVVSLKLKRIPMLKILIGLFYTFAGLVIFLTGVNIGFSDLGTTLGKELASGWTKFLLVPLAMLIGWFIVNAEPAVHVLTKNVEDISVGVVTQKAMRIALSISIAMAMGLSMIRILTGISIFWFVIPGYVLALAMSFYVPPIFTAIAFDSGGVASGPMTATFMLPFAMGACEALGGNILTDAFGLVALVAMMPLITVQIMGAFATWRTKKAGVGVSEFFADNNEIIELWEVV